MGDWLKIYVYLFFESFCLITIWALNKQIKKTNLRSIHYAMLVCECSFVIYISWNTLDILLIYV